MKEEWEQYQGPKDTTEGYIAEMLLAKGLHQGVKHSCHKHLSSCGMEDMWVMCAGILIS